MNRPRLRAFSQLKILILLFVGISLTSCAALPFLAPVFVEFARNLLMTTTKNHGGKYAADVNTMLMSFSKPIVATPYPARPQRPQQGGGYPNDPYGQGGGGYPNPNDPYGQGGGGGYSDPNDPYAQGGGSPNPNDPYGQGGGAPNPNDPYAQGGGAPNPNDPYAQGGGGYPNTNDPYGAGSNLAPTNSDPPLITENQYGGIDGSVPTGNPYEEAPSSGPTPETQGGGDREFASLENSPGGANVSERASHPVGPTQTNSDLGSSNAVSQGQPISIDVALVRQTKTTDGQKKITVIHDGDILKDGGDNPQSGDKFKIIFRTNCDCFVYVASADGSGWAQPLFPLGSAKGIPVKKDQEYVLPGENQSYALDQNKGIESIFFVASPWARPDIVKSFSTLAAQKKPSNFVALASVEEAPIIPNGFVAMRSAPRARVRDDLGKESFVVPTSYSGAGIGKEVRLTRWFHHE